jgi:type 1 glutamine amidotransferase
MLPFIRLPKLALLPALCLAGTVAAASAAPAYRAMLLTGQANPYHDWTKSTPLIRTYLEQTGLFAVDVVTTPPKGADMSGFRPKFSAYAVIVMAYEGAEWPATTKQAFIDYMRNGGGLVSIHDTDNAFPFWKEWNEMIGVGGWGYKPDGSIGARDETWGPKIRWRDGKMVLDDTPGKAQHPNPAYDYPVVTRAPEHPIMKGLPATWMHARDEIYSQLRGPAKNVTVLATAVPDLAKAPPATGENEPVLMTITYGQGRIFHTTFGHVAPANTPPFPALDCVGFIVTLQRGTEWAATGRVTQRVPDDFPTAEKVSRRDR